MRVWLLLMLAASSGACTINLIRKPADPERIKQQVDLFKWLYEKGVYRSDPEMMRTAAAKLLDLGSKEREVEPAQAEALERLVRRLEGALDRLTKDKPSP